MAHSKGGSGSSFRTKHAFAGARAFVSGTGVSFPSTTRETITAVKGFARDGTPTIVFHGERNRHGSVCQACWGFRIDCSGSRIGQCAEALDNVVP